MPTLASCVANLCSASSSSLSDVLLLFSNGFDNSRDILNGRFSLDDLVCSDCIESLSVHKFACTRKMKEKKNILILRLFYLQLIIMEGEVVAVSSVCKISLKQTHLFKCLVCLYIAQFEWGTCNVCIF